MILYEFLCSCERYVYRCFKNLINFIFLKCCINVMIGFISYLFFVLGFFSFSIFKEKVIRSDNEFVL